MKADQKLAQHMLAHKANGYSICYILRRSWWRYLIILAAAGGCLAVSRMADTQAIKWWYGCFFGILVGALLRDGGWFRKLKKQWPFTSQIINWSIVESMARGDAAANKASEATSGSARAASPEAPQG